MQYRNIGYRTNRKQFSEWNFNFFYFNINLVDNWQDVCEEICRSNIIQRDNQKFARKLSKDLVKLAKERSDLVSTNLSYLILGWRNTRKVTNH